MPLPALFVLQQQVRQHAAAVPATTAAILETSSLPSPAPPTTWMMRPPPWMMRPPPPGLPRSLRAHIPARRATSCGLSTCTWSLNSFTRQGSLAGCSGSWRLKASSYLTSVNQFNVGGKTKLSWSSMAILLLPRLRMRVAACCCGSMRSAMKSI